jgi:hypothetical protein
MAGTRRRSSGRAEGSTARTDDSRSEIRSRQQEADRYRRAAEYALEQLDWAITYLHGIHKVEISRALARNRSLIRQRLMERREEPVPARQASRR